MSRRIGAPYRSIVLLTAGNVAAAKTIKLAKEGKPGNAFQRNIEELDEIRACNTRVGLVWTIVLPGLDTPGLGHAARKAGTKTAQALKSFGMLAFVKRMRAARPCLLGGGATAYL